MIEFILNEEHIQTDVPEGMTVLDFVRYSKNLKGTKIGCREGDCGACNILVGELDGEEVRYRSMTSCLTPLANVRRKHVVTIEGINPKNGGLSPVQQAMVENNGTQCGFCTPGFIVSLTGFFISGDQNSPESAIASIDGNICRCTGYKPIERAAAAVCREAGAGAEVPEQCVPGYFKEIPEMLSGLAATADESGADAIVGGGTDLYVQRPEELIRAGARHVFFDDRLRGIRKSGDLVEIGASATVTDLLESPLIKDLFPNLEEHLKLVSSTPIRNMATLAGNFVNASPIGDMTIWFLSLDAEVELENGDGEVRTMPLRKLYLGYKDLALEKGEMLTRIRFRPRFTHFNFEKVCKRTYLDIASVNTAISLAVEKGERGEIIRSAHVSAGGVSPVPLYLSKTSDFLAGRELSPGTVRDAATRMQDEISPISDVRGSAAYKRLLLRQLFYSHFFELFDLDPAESGG